MAAPTAAASPPEPVAGSSPWVAAPTEPTLAQEAALLDTSAADLVEADVPTTSVETSVDVEPAADVSIDPLVVAAEPVTLVEEPVELSQADLDLPAAATTTTTATAAATTTAAVAEVYVEADPTDPVPIVAREPVPPPQRGLIPGSYWDLSERILPPDAACGPDEDLSHTKSGYWDLDKRIVPRTALELGEDDAPATRAGGYWDRSTIRR